MHSAMKIALHGDIMEGGHYVSEGAYGDQHGLTKTELSGPNDTITMRTRLAMRVFRDEEKLVSPCYLKLM